MVFSSLFIEITFFVCTNRINLLNLKLSSDRLVLLAKGFLKLPNLHMPLTQKSPSLHRNLGLETFGELLIVFSTKANLLYFLYSMDRRCCLLHLKRQNYLLKTFPRTNLKLHNISITPKMVKKVIMNLDLSKASGPDCIPVVYLKNC